MYGNFSFLSQEEMNSDKICLCLKSPYKLQSMTTRVCGLGRVRSFSEDVGHQEAPRPSGYLGNAVRVFI